MDWQELNNRWMFTLITAGSSVKVADRQVITHVDGDLRWKDANGPRIGPGTLLHANAVIHAAKPGADGINVYLSHLILTV